MIFVIIIPDTASIIWQGLKVANRFLANFCLNYIATWRINAVTMLEKYIASYLIIPGTMMWLFSYTEFQTAKL